MRTVTVPSARVVMNSADPNRHRSRKEGRKVVSIMTKVNDSRIRPGPWRRPAGIMLISLGSVALLPGLFQWPASDPSAWRFTDTDSPARQVIELRNYLDQVGRPPRIEQVEL